MQVVPPIPEALLVERPEPHLTDTSWRAVGQYALRVKAWGEAEARDRARIREILKGK